MLFAYPYTIDISKLRDSLRAVLVAIPDVKGRMVLERGIYYLRAGGEELDVTEAYFKDEMPKFGPAFPLEDERGGLGKPVSDRILNLNEPVCRIQLNTFDSGGSILAVKFCHALCDAGGRALFIANWAAKYRGVPALYEIDLDRKKMIPPTGDDASVRADILNALSPDRVRRSKIVSSPIDYTILRVSSESLEELYSEHCRSGGELIHRVSKQDLLAAKIWQDMLLSIQWPRCNLVKVESFRRNKDLPISYTYFGNAVVFAKVGYEYDGRTPSIGELARNIRERSDAVISAESIAGKSQYDPMIDAGMFGLECPYVVLNNLCRFPVSEMDFGGGPPCWVGGLSRPHRNILIFPGTKDDRCGELYLHVNLPIAEMQRLLMYVNEDSFYLKSRDGHPYEL